MYDTYYTYETYYFKVQEKEKEYNNHPLKPHTLLSMFKGSFQVRILFSNTQTNTHTHTTKNVASFFSRP